MNVVTIFIVKHLASRLLSANVFGKIQAQVRIAMDDDIPKTEKHARVLAYAKDIAGDVMQCILDACISLAVYLIKMEAAKSNV
jgi:hypothetical protein